MEEQEDLTGKNKNASSPQAGQLEMLVLQICHFLSTVFFCNYGLLANLSSVTEKPLVLNTTCTQGLEFQIQISEYLGFLTQGYANMMGQLRQRLY